MESPREAVVSSILSSNDILRAKKAGEERVTFRRRKQVSTVNINKIESKPNLLCMRAATNGSNRLQTFAVFCVKILLKPNKTHFPPQQ